jgi:hypothetical protein
MDIDKRCCGTGTCIIDKDGKCWCGQQWDGEKMCFQPLASDETPPPAPAEPKET